MLFHGPGADFIPYFELPFKEQNHMLNGYASYLSLLFTPSALIPRGP
jgi:hypothetical protein